MTGEGGCRTLRFYPRIRRDEVRFQLFEAGIDERLAAAAIGVLRRFRSMTTSLQRAGGQFPDARATGLRHELRSLRRKRFRCSPVTGDGIREYVPSTDRPGPAQPLRIYALSSPPETKPDTSTKPGFYLGGTIYQDWASVPASYKDVNPQYPDPGRSSASIFKFTW